VHGILTQAEEADSPVDGVVPVPSHHDPDPRRLEESPPIDIPAMPGQHCVAGG